MDKKKIAQLIIARLEGREIIKKFRYYQSLVRKGIGGFVIFGGKLREVREGIKNLQDEAEAPLFIASDLEQGLGQQIEGGTLFPPAMAVASAIDRRNKDDVKLLRRSIEAISVEAKAAGINLIFAPVADVNTNQRNPIICTRAFSDNPETAAWFASEFVKGFQRHGLIACVKHFPGHGDTAVDSHRELPIVKADIKRLNNVELYPFTQTIKAGVKMIMVGHLKVPAIDSRFPASLSKRTIGGLIRDKMKFQGPVTTDAMNMKAVSGRTPESEGKACLMALKAGADIILHPNNPEAIINYLFLKWNEIKPRVEESFQRIMKVKKGLNKIQDLTLNQVQGRIQDVGVKSHMETARAVTQKSIKIKNDITGWHSDQILVLIIDDDNAESGKPFINVLGKDYKMIKTIYVDNKYKGSIKTILNSVRDSILIAAVFSKVSAYKGRSCLDRRLASLLKEAVGISSSSVIVGFCCPYILQNAKADLIIDAYSVSDMAQECAANLLYKLLSPVLRVQV